jgi:hypothetical protein
VNQLAIQPVLYPRCKLIVVIDYAFPLFKLGIIHVAFGSGNNQFELLISAVVDVLAGIVIVNVVVDVLSDPKSKIAIDLFALDAL